MPRGQSLALCAKAPPDLKYREEIKCQGMFVLPAISLDAKENTGIKDSLIGMSSLKGKFSCFRGPVALSALTAAGKTQQSQYSVFSTAGNPDCSILGSGGQERHLQVLSQISVLSPENRGWDLSYNSLLYNRL